VRDRRRRSNRRVARRLLDRYDEAKQRAAFRRIEERERMRDEARRRADEEMLAKVDAARADIRAALEQKPKPWWRFW
jgi:hypothetical protein